MSKLGPHTPKFVPTPLPSTQLHSPNNIEAITVQITINHQTTVICLIYIPPNTDLEKHKAIMSFLKMFKDHNNVIVLGDLNLPDLNWELYAGHTNVSQDYADLVYAHAMCIQYT